MPAKRAAVATLVLAACGFAIGILLAQVHAGLAAGAGYTSFCNVNDAVNCDLVLSSDYAHVLGVPVAWWALITYLGGGALALIAWRAPRVSQRRQAATFLFAVSIAGVLYSAFLAYIAFFVLGTVCLLCSGLYVVNLGLLVSSAMLYAGARAAGRGADAWQGRTRTIVALAGVGGVLLVAAVGWKASGGGATVLTPEEIRTQQPEFYEWYSKLPRAEPTLDGGQIKGPATAPVVIVEFSDFECGHCAKAHQNLKAVLPRFAKDVQVRFHHFPLDAACNPAVKQSFHKYACLAAMASQCAGAQGKFWEYQDLLFEHQTELDRDHLLAYADQVGVAREPFLACLQSDETRRALERDVAEGVRLNVQSTPTLFINGRAITGAPEASSLINVIVLERAAARAAGD
ncbi:MAG: thioredoxin domain-containing protein [Candidatus Binatia bacterium]